MTDYPDPAEPTDPNVFVIDHEGVLRWSYTETGIKPELDSLCLHGGDGFLAIRSYRPNRPDLGQLLLESARADFRGRWIPGHFIETFTLERL